MTDSVDGSPRGRVHDDPWRMGDAERRARRVTAREERRHRRSRQNALAALAVGSLVALGAGTAAIAQVRTPAVVAPVSVVAQTPAPTLPAVAATPSVTASATAATPDGTPPVPAVKRSVPAASQRFTIAIGDAGYEPSVVKAKAGVPITLIVAKGAGCAAGFLMPSRGIAADNSGHRITIRLGKLKAGVYPFSCGMDMVQGRLVVR